ncbi:MAG TPA: hypothetical protein VFW68_15305, partial [Rhodocyclaceae bacterium]|nr:hypothetical protein [Rhodocyclaceae bacterium]
MSHKTVLRLDLLRMTSLLCAAAWIVVPSLSIAQEQVRAGRGASSAAENIQGLREKTRQSIAGFSGDAAGELDDATSLGQSLSGAARSLQTSKKDVATRTPDQPKAAPVFSDDFALPPATASGPKRVIPRPRNTETMSPLVPTPDFSRQKLVFAELAGR